MQRLFGTEHKQPLTDLRHEAIEQQMIKTQRVRQGVAKTRGRFSIEQECAIAILEVEIHQSDAARLAIGKMPREIGRQCRRADAAAGTDKRHHFPEL